jgi:8-oxo-dGTP diphosphatase
MTVFLVRHAKAGNRSSWEGDDTQRPLSGKGRLQADAIAKQLIERPIVRLVSSPYLRCVQTLEPLARRIDLAVVTNTALVEGAPFEPVLDLIATLPDDSVLCTHGDVLVDVIAAYERRGTQIGAGRHWGKGSMWVLERDGLRVIDATSAPPPMAVGG